MAMVMTSMALLLSSCQKEKGDDNQDPVHRDKVFLLYSAGFNSISSFMANNISSLGEGYLPSGKRNGNALLVFSKQPKSARDTVQTSPVLIQMYKNKKGRAVMDTVRTWPVGTPAASAQTLHDVLEYIKVQYPSDSYGMDFSSHATGWLPAGYYSRSFNSITLSGRRDGSLAPGEVPYIEEVLPGLPVKTIGQEYKNRKTVSLEIEIEDFAAAFPMHFDYILFDACLMGGIETAYALKDVTDKVGFSQAEVLAEGFDYTTIADRLLKRSVPAPELVCSDYFAHYNAMSGEYRSATISLIDCTKMDALGAVCKTLFSKYRDAIASVNPNLVQGYFRFNKHWFYDLRDILAKSGVIDEDMTLLDNAINSCIIYKAATPEFMKDFPINNFCGLSMYLPAANRLSSSGGSDESLNEYYRGLSWNLATGLLE